MGDPGDEQLASDDENARSYAWARDRFVELGYKPADAEELAVHGVDWHNLRALLAAGCSRSSARRLLLP